MITNLDEVHKEVKKDFQVRTPMPTMPIFNFQSAMKRWGKMRVSRTNTVIRSFLFRDEISKPKENMS